MRQLLSCCVLMLAAGVGTCLWLVFHGQAFGSTPVEALASVLPATLAGGAMASRAIPSQSAFRMEQWLDGHLAWLVCVWAAGVVMLSLRTAGGWIFAQTLKRHGTRPAETAWQQVLGRLANRLGVARRIALMVARIFARSWGMVLLEVDWLR